MSCTLHQYTIHSEGTSSVSNEYIWIDCDVPGYRGPASHDDAIYWNPRKPPCVPSDFRPAHLISSKLCAEAVCAARRLELFMPCEGIDPYDAERDAGTTLRALLRLQ
jgi:hypothetical protein